MESVSEPTVIATRAALQRIGFLSGATIVILAITLVISDLDFYLAMVGYSIAIAIAIAIAIVIGAAARLGGSERRRAGLLSGDESRSLAKGVFRLALGLSALTIILSIVALSVLNALAEIAGRGGLPTLTSDFWLAGIDSRHLIVIAVVSALVSALSLAGLVVVARRQSAAGAELEADRMIRALCSRRVAYGALGGQAVLLGALMPALQVFTLEVSRLAYSVNEIVVTVSSAVGLVIMVAGIVACASAVLFPVWIQLRDREPAAEMPDSSADASVDPGAEPDRDAGFDAGKRERG
ncbi:hypothetical protein [Cryobacterium sp. Y50]|uniref:hypothetical protein n=1 Tax=Cryobacterium sp. Y50 TaxID=2048286 RepID=UPI000CE38B8F|nr:hypothetical protein [Cryobacterium sp. Y50]